MPGSYKAGRMAIRQGAGRQKGWEAGKLGGYKAKRL
jgi:hypothetical protein